jgi:hypothetical protein
MTKEELQTSLELIKSEIKKIKKQYACEMKDGLAYNEFLSASDGFEMLINRINKQVKKFN